MKDDMGAVDDATKAIQINSEYAAAFLNRGIAKEMLRDNKGACLDWGKAKKLGSEMAAQYLTDCK